MRISDVYNDLFDDAGNSFIFGAASSSIKNIINRNNNLITTQIQSIKKAVGMVEYTVYYNIIMTLGKIFRIRRFVSAVISVFMASYLTGKRNGRIFALKNAAFGLMMNTVGSFIRF